MTNYNDGKWHGWNGGECPVHPETVVEIIRRNKRNGNLIAYTGNAGIAEKSSGVEWSNKEFVDLPIVAFRVVKEHKEPHEFWLIDVGGGFLEVNHGPQEGGIHVREVIK